MVAVCVSYAVRSVDSAADKSPVQETRSLRDKVGREIEVRSLSSELLEGAITCTTEDTQLVAVHTETRGLFCILVIDSCLSPPSSDKAAALRRALDLRWTALTPPVEDAVYMISEPEKAPVVLFRDIFTRE
jgi:hypothetical protein